MKDINLFKSQPLNTKVLLATAAIYAFVLPVIEIFQAAYIMGQSADMARVVLYQLMVYTGVPITFIFNGFLLRKIAPGWLYSFGMLLGGISMLYMTSLPELTTGGIGIAGLIMGLSFGFFWANRDYLVLVSTTDGNRNYYYGTEAFFNTFAGVVMPIIISTIIVYITHKYVGLSNVRSFAYQVISYFIIGLTIIASVLILTKGKYEKPDSPRFLYFKFDNLWNRMLLMAVLKGLVQGFIVTAPSILIFKFIGEEGALGPIQSVCALVTAFLMYIIGRNAKPEQRLHILFVSLALFIIGAVTNSLLFNTLSVVIFLLCLVVARPMFDIAYFPIQLRVIDFVSGIEKRNEYTYICNHEWGLYTGRLIGCGLFILIAKFISEDAALKITLPLVTILQGASYFVARNLLTRMEKKEKESICDKTMCNAVVV